MVEQNIGLVKKDSRVNNFKNIWNTYIFTLNLEHVMKVIVTITVNFIISHGLKNIDNL